MLLARAAVDLAAIALPSSTPDRAFLAKHLGFRSGPDRVYPSTQDSGYVIVVAQLLGASTLGIAPRPRMARLWVNSRTPSSA